MALPLEDYGVIGDCETAALVGRDGSIDWLCLPRFDSPACFAALLGTEDNGRWQIAPAGPATRVRRRYRQDTLILETEFETDTGAVRLIDFMARRTKEPDVMRIVQGIRGRVEMQMDLTIRFDYGAVVPWVRRIEGGISAVAGPEVVYLQTPVETHGEGLHTKASFTVSEGQHVPFTLAWAPSHLQPPRNFPDPLRALKHTERWWRDWCARSTYKGPWREAVMRSLITLKALTHTDTGGIVAAVTTSIPEQLGGERNWDYRACWLRDATFTLYALMTGGYQEEAAAWRDWLLRAVAGAPAQMHIMYGLAGERRLPELELPWLPGYEGAKPVRIGNAAQEQFQLDVFGEVMDALHLARRIPRPKYGDYAWDIQKALMDFLESKWQEPDNGIWEVRGPRRHFTHSKVLAWVAFDRAVKAVERSGLEGPVDRWRALRDMVHDEICHRGFNTKLNSFVQYYGATEPDASLLVLPEVGFLPASDSRVMGTVQLVQERLVEDGFVRRYDTRPEVDGLPSGEASFILCTFWLADNLALQGRFAEAQECFERVLGVSNELGLLSEGYDTKARRLLGNFPQAFSHMGLINTARNLAGAGGPAERRQEGDPPSS